MPALSGGIARWAVAVSTLVFAGLPASAQMDTAQFKRFRQEAAAFNRTEPSANAYRAGRHNGYLVGVMETLRSRGRVCFDDCVCEIDKMVDQHLAEHPEPDDRPVIDWLVPLMEERFPCK